MAPAGALPKTQGPPMPAGSKSVPWPLPSLSQDWRTTARHAVVPVRPPERPLKFLLERVLELLLGLALFYSSRRPLQRGRNRILGLVRSMPISELHNLV